MVGFNSQKKIMEVIELRYYLSHIGYMPRKIRYGNKSHGHNLTKGFEMGRRLPSLLLLLRYHDE